MTQGKQSDISSEKIINLPKKYSSNASEIREIYNESKSQNKRKLEIIDENTEEKFKIMEKKLVS